MTALDQVTTSMLATELRIANEIEFLALVLTYPGRLDEPDLVFALKEQIKSRLGVHL
jgi:hypothetical protein